MMEQCYAVVYKTGKQSVYDLSYVECLAYVLSTDAWSKAYKQCCTLLLFSLM